MLGIIGEFVQNILDNYGLTDYCSGVVENIEPFTVRINDRLLLKRDNLILAVAQEDFSVGDNLVMLKVLRGQKYILLAKVNE